MKTLLPWLCVVALAFGLGWVYSNSQKKDAELAALRQDSQQLQQLRAELEDAKKTGPQASADELARLRKDNEDLLRLRNEVGQLRKEKQQLAMQVQAAQSQAVGAQAQAEALRTNLAQSGVAAAQAAFNARYGQDRMTAEQQQASVCIRSEERRVGK